MCVCVSVSVSVSVCVRGWGEAFAYNVQETFDDDKRWKAAILEMFPLDVLNCLPVLLPLFSRSSVQ